jgi:hypothetical protein
MVLAAMCHRKRRGEKYGCKDAAPQGEADFASQCYRELRSRISP